MTEKLRFYARGTACVPDPHGSDAMPQRRRMVARKHEQIAPGSWGWVPTAADSLPPHQDLIKAARDGDLWPADEATALACGVKFDPKFGDDGQVIVELEKAAKAAADKIAKEKEAARKAAPAQTAGTAGGKADG